MRSPKPGLARCTPRVHTAHHVARDLLVAFCKARGYSERDLAAQLECNRSLADGRLTGDYNFLVRDLFLLTEREALDLVDRIRDALRDSFRSASNHR